MEAVQFNNGRTYEPEEGWRRIKLAGSERFTFEWFEKPSGHSSPMHDHENEQVCIVLEAELTVHTETESGTLGPYDSVRLDTWEEHRVANTDDERAVGLDVFAPGRSFDFWMEREE